MAPVTRTPFQVFQEEIRGTGVCLAFFETFTRATLARDMERAAGTIQSSSARVILVFAWYTDIRVLLLELAKRNVRLYRWIAFRCVIRVLPPTTVCVVCYR